jgi:hypothetical protein
MATPERPSSRGYERPPRSPEALANRDAVLDQLNRILSSVLFKNSKRCGPLLRYIVNETIEGRGEYLKERSIGVAVFGRKPTYDTNEDRIVRTAAVEVRKRIAQYYQEPGHEAELLIDVTSGSYVPKIRTAAEMADQAKSGANHHAGQQTAAPFHIEGFPPLSVAVPSASNALWISAITLAVVVSAVAAGLWGRAILANRPLDRFWGPLLRGKTVTLVMGDVMESDSPDSRSPGRNFLDTMRNDRVGYSDGLTMARVASMIDSRGKKFEIRRGGSLTLQDLRKAPAVMVGAFNNPWSVTLEEGLRFQFALDDSKKTVSLRDQQDPAHPLWSVDLAMPYAALREDRAIISRFVDSRTEQVVLLLAGLGRDGTAAAGEFVTEPRYLRTLTDMAPRGWPGNNLQTVIATDLVNGHSGAPRVIKAYFW